MNNEFLKLLDQQHNINHYVEIIALDINDLPLEKIEGKITGGNINLDGSSSIRRVCSLSLVASLDDNIITDSYWCFNTKIKIRIGKENYIDNTQPPIVWFDQGIFILTSFSASYNINSISINLQGKDKMCRLNGEVSGALPMSTDFGQIETYIDSETIKLDKIPIKTIIRNAVKEYGCEREENIIINDLDDYGYELWEYRGIEPLYYFKEINGNIRYMTLEDNIKLFIKKEDGSYSENAISINSDSITYYSSNTLDPYVNKDATIVKINTNSEDEYYIIKIYSDETAGYHRTELVYNTDLILRAGETVTALLDKLTAMLGNFEYFYDTNGRFVFQKKNDYIYELYSTSSGALNTPQLYNQMYSYRFDNKELFTTISVSPDLSRIKNDFSVWGQKQTASGNSLPIHARCAINSKPKSYISPWDRYMLINKEYINDFDKETFYIKQNNEYIAIKSEDINNEIYNKSNFYIKIEAQTKYSIEEYDWREIIYQMAIDFYRHNQESDYLLQIENNNKEYIKGNTGYEQYYSDIEGFWRQLYSPYGNFDAAADGDYYSSDAEYFKYWNKKIHTDPSSIIFWFDFLDTGGQLSKYSVKKIGSRSKVLNENAVTSIYYKEVPEVQFLIVEKDSIIQDNSNTAYTVLQITEDDEPLFARSSQGISAIEKVNELIQSHVADIDTLNITSVPIFYLQPNTRIYIADQGDYTINKISYNLNYNGTMTISANKILKQFI